jgi:UDP-N-acetylmuramate dehydrogenase
LEYRRSPMSLLKSHLLINLKLLIQSQKLNNFLVLGGGSNILFTKDFDGLILKNQLLGISVLEENNETVLVKAAGGENWHNFVRHCVSNGWGGIENLSLIPGTVWVLLRCRILVPTVLKLKNH